LDVDGNLDMYLSNGIVPLRPEDNQLFWTDGDGGFVAASGVVAAGAAASIYTAAIDLNADDHLDLFVCNAEEHDNQVFLGDGDRGFVDVSESAQYAVICKKQISHRHVHILDADLNGDGHMDLFITVKRWDNKFFAGDGAGTFSAVVNGATPYSATSLYSTHTSAGDFNGDGYLDLYVLNGGANLNQLFVSDGNGDFVGQVNAARWPSIPRFLDRARSKGLSALSLACVQTLDPWVGDEHSAIVDLNGDGQLDILSSGGNSMSMTVHLGKDASANRFFKPNDPNNEITRTPEHPDGSARPWTHSSWHTAVGDLNGDSAIDLFVCGDLTNLIFTGDGHGGFAHICKDLGNGRCDTTNEFQRAKHALIRDLNGDGHADIFMLPRGGGTMYFLGDGDMGFTQVQSGDAVRLSECSENYGIPGHTAAADLNGDSNVDLYVSCKAGVESQVLLGDGSGGFTAQTGPAASGPASASVKHTSIGDLNGDNNLDLFLCTDLDSSDVLNQIYYGVGDGSFTKELAVGDNGDFLHFVNLDTHRGGCRSILVDLTGDEKLDIYVVYDNDKNELYAGDGAGGFTDDTQNDNPLTSGDTYVARTQQVICEDLDGDQHLDVYLTCDGMPGNNNMLFHGDGAGNFVRDTTSPAALGGGTSGHTAAADLNGGALASFTANSTRKTESQKLRACVAVHRRPYRPVRRQHGVPGEPGLCLWLLRRARVPRRACGQPLLRLPRLLPRPSGRGRARVRVLPGWARRPDGPRAAGPRGRLPLPRVHARPLPGRD
jgi:hypothetical protein